MLHVVVLNQHFYKISDYYYCCCFFVFVFLLLFFVVVLGGVRWGEGDVREWGRGGEEGGFVFDLLLV